MTLAQHTQIYALAEAPKINAAQNNIVQPQQQQQAQQQPQLQQQMQTAAIN